MKTIIKTIMITKMKMILITPLLLLVIPGAAGDYNSPGTYNIPQSFDLGQNYYNVYGGPDLSANIIGDTEFDRDQTLTLNVDIMNKGKLLGLENDRTPSTSDEIFAAQTEAKLESSVVDATNVMAYLSTDPGSPIEVKSASQQIGSIKSGENVIDIVIKNTGEEEARNVKAIINPADPLSTTDSMAFLSTLAPGNTTVAHVKIKEDSAAVPKTYGVDTVLKYETPEGDTNYSDTLQAPIEVKQTGFFQSILGWL